jgi:hypothetical protein
MRTWRGLAITVGVALVLGGCRAAAAPPASAPGGTIAPLTSSASRSTPAATDAAIATAVPPGPPNARLAVDGGDPVTGQLGTYIWHGNGSDSPWLPGAPMTLGAGEPLTLTLVDGSGVASWRARVVPATQIDPAGARSLGEGRGTPTFAAPGAGRWTVEVEITFLDGAGIASYAWQLQVR